MHPLKGQAMVRRKTNKPRRPGVAAVELAVVLPFLVFLLLGVWEVGRMVEVKQLLVNAAREGGRQASTCNKTISQVQDDVVNYLIRNGIKSVKNSDVTVVNLTNASRNDPTTANQLDHYRVTVYGNQFAYFEFHNPQGAQIIRHQFPVKTWEVNWNVEPDKVAA